MNSRLPTIISLQCFAAAAHHLNMTYAGEALHLTQSAVSRQIKKLEEHIGRDLFYRENNQLLLTPVGEQLATEVGKILGQLEAAVDKMSQPDRRDESVNIRVATEPTLAMRWLMPRVKEFNASYPHIKVDLFTDYDYAARNLRKFDLAILWGESHADGYASDFLRSETYVAVGSSEIIKSSAPSPDPLSILNYDVLHHNSVTSSTESWFTSAGLSQKEILKIPGQHYEHFIYLAEAVSHGLGVSVLPEYLVEDDIDSGNLKLASSFRLSIKGAYYVTYAEDRLYEYGINHFRKWLLSHRQF